MRYRCQMYCFARIIWAKFWSDFYFPSIARLYFSKLFKWHRLFLIWSNIGYLFISKLIETNIRFSRLFFYSNNKKRKKLKRIGLSEIKTLRSVSPSTHKLCLFCLSLYLWKFRPHLLGKNNEKLSRTWKKQEFNMKTDTGTIQRNRKINSSCNQKLILDW